MTSRATSKLVLPVLSASEVGEYAYCPRSWWVRRHGATGAAIGTTRRAEGTDLHAAIGRATDSLQIAEIRSRTLRRIGWVLVLLAAGLALVSLVPRVWADGETSVSQAFDSFGWGQGPVLVLGLLVAGALALSLGSRLAHRARRLRQGLGLEHAGRAVAVVAADDARLGSRTLRADRLGLVARPDHLVLLGNRFVVPIEQKPRARRLYPSHLLELGAQLVAVDQSFGRRPPYGVVVLADGRSEEVTFERDLELAVETVVAAMRRLLAGGVAPRQRWLGGRCRACEYYSLCWTQT